MASNDFLVTEQRPVRRKQRRMRKHAYRLQFIFLAVAIESVVYLTLFCYELGPGRNEDWLEEYFFDYFAQN